MTSDAATTLVFQWLVADTNTTVRLTDPLGVVIDASTPAVNSNVQYSATVVASNLLVASFTIASPTAGVWTAVLDASSMTATEAAYTLTVQGDSPVTLVPQTGPLFNGGQDVVVTCQLADLSADPVGAVTNAALTAMVLLPNGTTNNLTLFDNGWHNDGAPNDGVYAAVLANVQLPGEYAITYRAYGTNSAGQAFQRVATGVFSVATGNGGIFGDPVYESVDTDGDGYADVLIVKVWVNVAAAGDYVLSGQLVDAMGLNRYAQSAQFAAAAAGPMQVSLIFDLAEIRAKSGQGDYHIESLQLFETGATVSGWLDAYRGVSSLTLPAANPVRAWLAGFGLPSDGSADFADSDGDGHNNTQEYWAGTNPTDPTSRLQVTTTAPAAGGGFTITWQSVPGKTYKVVYAENPGGPWEEDLPDSQITAQTGETSLSYTDTTVGNATKRFYRIKLIVP